MTIRVKVLRRLPVIMMLFLWLSACEVFDRTPPIDEPVVPPAPAVAACPPVEPCVCPVPETIKVPVPVPVSSPCDERGSKLTMLGSVEWVSVQDEGVRARARIDTGATTSSMHAEQLREFERDGKPWLRFSFDPGSEGESVELVRQVERRVRIKRNDGSSQRRYVVKMVLTVGDITENVEVTLNDRSDFEYPILIGRNFLTDNALVDVSGQMLATKAGGSSRD